MKKILQEFKQFAMRGNVVDMAVGIIIGGAFGKIVSSIVADLIMPAVGLLVGGVNFTDLKITLKHAVMEGDKVISPAVSINYGNFIQVTLDFIIIAFAVFLLVKGVNALSKKKEEAPAPEEPKGPTSEDLLTEIRDLLNEYEFPGDDTPIIKGSAYLALTSESKDVNAPEYKCILDLMDAVDDYIPTPERKADQPFLMPVEDVFTITGRGTVATGRVERGQLAVNTPVEIVGIRPTQTTTVTSIETFHKTMDACEAGDNTGLLLRGINRTDVERGQVVAKPGSVTPHTKFEGEVYVLTKDEGGRHSPFFSNYRPQFYFRTTDVTGVIELPEGVEMVQPGDHATFTVELIQPIAMEEGLTFAVREGGHTVGSGRVTKILA